MNRIRAKIYGERLVHADYQEIMRDCVAGRLADIELATFLTALSELAMLGADNVTCVIVHALFAEGADKALLDAGARRVVSTNTVPHATNDIDVVPSSVSAIDRFLHR